MGSEMCIRDSLREFMWIVVVTACLLTKLQESLLDLNVWQQVDFGERADAHVLEAMLPSDMRKPINDPRRLVIAAVRIRVGR